MSWIITGVALFSAASTAVNQRNAAKSDEIQLEQQAEQEALAAEGRELGRRQQLNKVLAQNVVSQAASGISGEGTPESIALASAKQASLSEGVLDLSDRLRQSQLKRKGLNIRSAGDVAATSTLLKSGAAIARQG